MTDEEEMRELALLRRKAELIAVIKSIDQELIIYSKRLAPTF